MTNPATPRRHGCRDRTEALVAAYVRQVLAAAPPLTDEQRTRLAELLKPVRLTVNQPLGGPA
jgi:hypothetical protein